MLQYLCNYICYNNASSDCIGLHMPVFGFDVVFMYDMYTHVHVTRLYPLRRFGAILWGFGKFFVSLSMASQS